MKRVAIVQSNYVPWRGYFDLIRSVDEFILLDDVQYTKHSWRNRNRIKTSNGTIWLTIPVRCRGGPPADAVEIADPGWAKRHLKTLAAAYGRATGYEYWEEWLKELYLGREFASLSHVNRVFLESICRALGVSTSLTQSRRYPVKGSKSERVLELCLAAGAQEYVSGPAARSYLDEGAFRREGIALRWFEYPSYPAYQQRWPPYEPRVSILDLLLNTGPDAGSFLSELSGTATAVVGVK
jgi:hypothetical protein